MLLCYSASIATPNQFAFFVKLNHTVCAVTLTQSFLYISCHAHVQRLGLFSRSLHCCCSFSIYSFDFFLSIFRESHLYLYYFFLSLIFPIFLLCFSSAYNISSLVFISSKMFVLVANVWLAARILWEETLHTIKAQARVHFHSYSYTYYMLLAI